MTVFQQVCMMIGGFVLLAILCAIVLLTLMMLFFKRDDMEKLDFNVNRDDDEYGDIL